jgi:hypothetical protein
MSAKPELVLSGPSFDHRDKVIEAQMARMEEDSHIIRGLRKQNERLKEEKLNAELEASLEIAKAKFAAAQVGEALRRVVELERRVTAAEADTNNLRNWIAGNAVQRDQEYENMRGNVSYLMGAHQP